MHSNHMQRAHLGSPEAGRRWGETGKKSEGTNAQEIQCPPHGAASETGVPARGQSTPGCEALPSTWESMCMRGTVSNCMSQVGRRAFGRVRWTGMHMGKSGGQDFVWLGQVGRHAFGWVRWTGVHVGWSGGQACVWASQVDRRVYRQVRCTGVCIGRSGGQACV